jgi:demethylmenaquinone methyltransferase/2-methoxy-6-polyprenyl-1,4-benzoquinol methylase
VSDLLSSQRQYYAARAPEYDDWWFRRGRYALPPEREAAWNADVAEAEAALEAFAPRGDVVELAAGTGLWTRHLARLAHRVVALDVNPEVLELNAGRVGGNVVYRLADLFEWHPDDQFDVCFFGFWLSHVPDDRFDAFWRSVRAALRPGGRVFLVDNVAGDPTHAWKRTDGDVETRSVADGREFDIVKRRWQPDELAARVRPLGFELDLRSTAHGHFLYGGGP